MVVANFAAAIQERQFVEAPNASSARNVIMLTGRRLLRWIKKRGQIHPAVLDPQYFHRVSIPTIKQQVTWKAMKYQAANPGRRQIMANPPHAGLAFHAGCRLHDFCVPALCDIWRSFHCEISDALFEIAPELRAKDNFHAGFRARSKPRRNASSQSVEVAGRAGPLRSASSTNC